MPSAERISVGIAAIGGVLLVFWGLWAFFWPQSFFDNIATFEPYNDHFVKDIGAFQVGLGLTLLLAIWSKDALFAAMAGVGAGCALHAIAHVIDRGEGGRASDPPALGILALLLFAGAALRWRAATVEAAADGRDTATAR